MTIHDFISDNKSQLISALIGSSISIVLIVFIIGRARFVWLIKELVKMYAANERSFFSKKRIESGVAYVILQHGMIFWLANKYSVMTTTEFIEWAIIEATISGWMITQIQKEKLTNGGGNTEEKKDNTQQ